MNIAFFTESWLPLQTGVAQCVALEVSELEKQGHIVYVITPGKKEKGEDKEKILRIPTFNFGAMKKNNQHFGVTIEPLINMFLSKAKIDVVHCHTEIFLGWAAQAWAKTNHIPFVHTTHTQWSEYWESYLSSWLPKAMFDSLLKSYYNRCTLILSPSQKGIEILEKMKIKRPAKLLANASSFIPVTESQLELRKKYSIPEDCSVLISVGRLSSEKRALELAQTSIGLLQSNNKLQLIFVGNGNLTQEIEQLFLDNSLENQVIFTGFLPSDLVAEYLKLSDIYVTASISEMHSIAILEALNHGLALVTRKDISYNDTVINDYNGMQLENDLQISDYLTKLTQDSVLLSSFKQHSLEVSSHFTPQVHTQKLIDYYRESLYSHVS
jgi:1,2-diacylglycerol 3-alpha-glucosyltransferase